METPLTMSIVGTKLDEIEALRAKLETELGATPAINVRCEIILGSDRTTISITDGMVTVRDDTSNQIVAIGTWDIARAAIKGMSTA